MLITSDGHDVWGNPEWMEVFAAWYFLHINGGIYYPSLDSQAGIGPLSNRKWKGAGLNFPNQDRMHGGGMGLLVWLWDWGSHDRGVALKCIIYRHVLVPLFGAPPVETYPIVPGPGWWSWVYDTPLSIVSQYPSVIGFGGTIFLC